ncbi:acetoacetate decarboxylase family protein [Ottowia sp.]|uniref:acetoacetate decarboxylase family protein n=1 Tax=Ottowia sp. TaxID=1898956 RepID=UPI0039E4EBFD
MKPYDINSFFKFLNYGPGDRTYQCPDLKTLSVTCRGDAAQLKAMLEPTPFELADDRFVVSVADFSNVGPRNFFDAAVILAVRYGDQKGGNYYFEYEDNQATIAGGRELWGYPKHFAMISLEEKDGNARARAWREGETIFEIAMEGGVEEAAKPSDLQLYPHLQVRAVPQANGPSFQSFEILSRNTVKDYQPKLRKAGKGSVTLGKAVSFGGTPLKVVEVLGAEYTVGDFYATAENGTPKIVANLV